MINVNVNELKNKIDELNSIINEYEEIQLNLFENLKNSCINWKDGNSIEFDNNSYLDKRESDLLLQSIKEKEKIYNSIYDKYSMIGKKISCNLNSKNKLLYEIENCYNQCLNIINKFDAIDKSFNYIERQSIIQQRTKFQNIKNKISECKNSIVKIFDKIEKIEKDINVKIKELEEIKINDFEFNLNNKYYNHSKEGILDKSLLEKDIEKIQLYINEEDKTLNKISEILEEGSNSYSSVNTNLLLNDIAKLKTSSKSLLDKRTKYPQILNNVIERYNNLSNITKNKFNEDK